MRFIDLFAGLGGFHLALRTLGHRCVFACEIGEALRQVYERNFGMSIAGDIRDISAADIPPHDILCAGFPCQPFSKAGDQEGLEHPKLGGLYGDMLRVIRYHQPRYLILENVPNLARHNKGKTWKQIERRLHQVGYDVSLKKLSPHHFGIPQIRERIYIVGSLDPLGGFKWPGPVPSGTPVSIRGVLDRNPPEARTIPEQVRRCLAAWQEFLDLVPKDEKIPHPLWSMEFGATYPYENTTPSALSTEELGRYCGSFGLPLAEAKDRDELFRMLPSHATREGDRFPRWKVDFIRKNREFYARHRALTDQWKPKIMQFPPSFQKLEWNCQETDPRKEVRCLDKYVIQIRPSGVRIKRPTTAPSLVAMTATQVPIIAWEERYMTPTECKRLQSMESLELPDSDSKAYEALGNAVNVRIASLVAEALVGRTPEESAEKHAAGGSRRKSKAL